MMTAISYVGSCDHARGRWRRSLRSHSLVAMRAVGLVAALAVALGCSGSNNAAPSQSQKSETVAGAAASDVELVRWLRPLAR